MIDQKYSNVCLLINIIQVHWQKSHREGVHIEPLNQFLYQKLLIVILSLKLAGVLRVNVNKNHRLSKKSRTQSKIDLVNFLPVGSLSSKQKETGLDF